MNIFSVPADFKLETLEKIKALNDQFADAKVGEVYGQATDISFQESGRALSVLPRVDMKQLEIYIRQCSNLGIKFNYTINPACIGNAEFTVSGNKRISHLLKTLHEIGISDLTITLPSLMEMARSISKEFRIKASAICEITSPSQARFYKQLGVDKIVLDPDITRDFAALRNICESYNGKSEIIVNNVCMKHCAYKKFHYNHDSHAVKREQSCIDDYYTNRCALQKASSLEASIKINWIRPEDLKYYSSVGIQYFKIQGRQNVLKGNLIKTLVSYMSTNYDGNLFDLITMFDSYTAFQPYIDNKSLDGFLKPFVDGQLICCDRCDICNYCKIFAEKSMSINETQSINEMAICFFRQVDKYTRAVEDNRNQGEILLNSFTNFE